MITITLTQLLIGVGIAAILLTLMVGALKKQKNWLVTFLQNYCGALFIFSGGVKVVDPLGTAYKLEQYFAEFQTTFEGTWLSFIAPMFPWLAEYGIIFSVIVIVFEIVLGIMLILGANNRFTSWAFMLLVAFFTGLTGFTYLTGYVPEDVNFFQFGKWGPYVESNMKVTDCGCFGDFLKLKPYTSFLKDVFLLIPAFIFLFKHKDMHTILTGGVRSIITGVATVGLLIYSLSNFVWDIPGVDFRPFRVGVNVAEQQALEEKAQGEAPVDYRMTNKETKKEVVLPMAQYLKQYKNYPKEEWELEQLRGEPAIPITKISDFAVESVEGNDVTQDILSDENYSLMFVCYKLYHDYSTANEMVNDTIFAVDTVRTADTMMLVRKVQDIKQVQQSKSIYDWDKGYQLAFKNTINPLAEAAEKDGLNVYGIAGAAGEEMIEEFRHANQTAFPFYMADDILLKTIVRSNPGIVLLKNGKIVNKWHYKQVPNYEDMKATYGIK